ncbi:MalY/PatB family protein [Bacillus gobiensis]|uniref:MalY/PatB family protein n=1 Tax=Bacillus gobiensis TaxID=1441095 RepID=UPI003D254CBE
MIFDQIEKRYGSQSVKWDLTKELFGADDALPMWVADMDFKAPDAVIGELQKRLEHGIFGYSSPTLDTKKSVVNWLLSRHNWEIQQDSLVFSPGIVTALSMAVQAYTEPGDQVGILVPVYTPFHNVVKDNHRKLITSSLMENNGRYEINFDELEEMLKQPETKLFIFCHPHNPSGRAWTKEELAKIGDLCLKHQVMVISDEIHSDLMLYNKRHVPFASLSPELADQTITCVAPSKTFNLAGLQASAIIIPNGKKRKLFTETMNRNGLNALNSFAITAIEAAYSYGENWLEELIPYLEKNVDLVKTSLQESLPEVKVMIPDASYLLWIDCRNLGLTDKELAHQLIHKGKLILEPGDKYGAGGEGFVRMNIGCPLQTVKDGISRFISTFQ